MYLTGTYKHSLDAKFRITLPSVFRKQLGDVICLVPLNNAVYGFTPESHRAWIQSFFPQGVNPRDQRAARLRTALLSRTLTLDLDSAGRLALGKLDPKQLEAVNIQKDVAVVGVDDHFEIWDAATFDAQSAMFDANLDDLMYGQNECE